MPMDEFNHKTITLNVCQKASLIVNDGFRKDFIRSVYVDPKYSFGSLPLEYDLSDLSESQKAAYELTAASLMAQIKSDTSIILLLNDDCVMLIKLPKYWPKDLVDEKEANSYQRNYQLLLDNSFGGSDPLKPAEMMSEYQWGDEHCHALSTPERIEYLNSLPKSELLKVPFPREYCFYLNLLVTKSSSQGKGVGKRAIHSLLDYLTSLRREIKPPQGSIQGVEKLCLFSSPVAVDFYKHVGFSVGATEAHVQANGEYLEHTYFYMNL